MGGHSIYLSEMEGEALKEALISGEMPKFVALGNDLVASHQISGVYAEYEELPKLNMTDPKMTPEQLKNRRKVLAEMKKKLNLLPIKEE
jgi:hypothetical protein